MKGFSVKNLVMILLAASFGAPFVSVQAKPASAVTGKTKLGVPLKGVKLGRDWTRR